MLETILCPWYDIKLQYLIYRWRDEFLCLFAWVYGIVTIVGYFMPNPLYTYILNVYDLVWLSFMTYQPLYVILCQILFIHIY